MIAPVVRAAECAGAIDRWFFIRYSDPDQHLRVRFHGAPARLYGEVLPALHEAARPLLADGRMWRLQLDTYEREVERYGGAAGIELAEQLFHADSVAALAIVERGASDAAVTQRWRLALRGIDALLSDLGFDVDARHTLIRQARDGFAREFRADIALERQLGDTYRRQRKHLETLLDPALDEEPLLAGMALAAAVTAALTWRQQVYLLRRETRLALGTASRFLWHIVRLPMEFFTQRYGGEIGSRVAINDLVATLLSERLATTALSLVMIVFYAALMFRYDVVLTLVSIAMVVLNLAALRYVSRRRVDSNQKLIQESGKLVGTAMNGLQMIETIKASGAESDFFTRWSGHLAKVENARQELAVSNQALAVVPALLAALNAVAVLSVGALRVMDGSLSVGMLVAYQSLVASFIAPVNTVVTLGSTLQDVEGHLNRLDDVLQYPVDRQLAAAEQPPSAGPAKLSGALELRDVTFGYSRLDRPLIEGLSLRLRPGDRVALVGGSGSGKSTVARLVAGLFEPWVGEILFDGQQRAAIPRALLQNSLAMVDQDIFLFEGSVRENLTLWDETAPEPVIVQAARDASIHEDIAARSGGYDSPVEEGGRNFSGGQRQRIEIARALATGPSVLILDEATSALDPITELLIDDNIRRRGCTCLIVAHRLSTIRDCDEIIVLERGQVVQRGTHDEMARVAGPYARLIAAE